MKAPDRFAGSVDYLCEAASKVCGLTDFGTDDYSTGLNILLESLDIDPRFTPQGREMAWDTIVLTMVSRAYAEENWKKFPAWKDHKLKQPIMICGHPRTGTTVLHKLMGADPQFQGVQNWLTKAPQPRPPREEWINHPAFQRAVNWIANQHSASPDIAFAHRVVADELDEEYELQRQTFECNIFASIWYCAGYDAWWSKRNERPWVMREMDLLKLIGCHEPDKRYLLKNPQSIGQLDYWFEQVPDTCVIQTHRDPVKAVASIASTIHFYKVAHEGAAAERTRKILGPREMEKWAYWVDRGTETRKRHQGQFFDVHHHELHANPMKVIGEIYDHFGLHLSAEAERAIAARIEENPDGHGKHRYDLESFGLSREMILERHAGYIEQFGLGR